MTVVRHAGTRSAPGWLELDELLRRSDIVSLHVPPSSETQGLIDRRRLGLMKDGASLVNAARAHVVDKGALSLELMRGRLSAALDVFAHEPHVDDVLLTLPNVVLTPHIGSATNETRAAMTQLVVDNVLAFLREEPLLTRVA